jgi:hypothetical protein
MTSTRADVRLIPSFPRHVRCWAATGATTGRPVVFVH